MTFSRRRVNNTGDEKQHTFEREFRFVSSTSFCVFGGAKRERVTLALWWPFVRVWRVLLPGPWPTRSQYFQKAHAKFLCSWHYDAAQLITFPCGWIGQFYIFFPPKCCWQRYLLCFMKHTIQLLCIEYSFDSACLFSHFLSSIFTGQLLRQHIAYQLDNVTNVSSSVIE